MDRIETIISQIVAMEAVADIGCDHGLIGKLLLEQGRARRVIAVDISVPSLQKAADMARKSGLAIETRLGDGLSPLQKGEAQAAVIAGMGGILIRDILAAEPEKARAMELLVLAPNRNEGELRCFLRENGLILSREALAKERGKFYQVICAAAKRAGNGGVREQDPFADEYGDPRLRIADPLAAEFYQAKMAQTERILERAKMGRETRGQVAYLQQKYRWLERQLDKVRGI